MAGIEGGFDSKEPEYEVTYSIVILPEFISLPFPSVELPEKVYLATEHEDPEDVCNLGRWFARYLLHNYSF